MKLDFWNNPIIVSAFRVRFRRGGLFNITTIYIMLLAVGGIILYRYKDRFQPHPWPQIYLLCLFGLQIFISAMIAGSTTAASIRSEVASRTLDFQRISSLSPMQILFGKLLGEPALAYLLAISTVPLAAWCWMLGVDGVSLVVLVLLYVNLATTTILIGSLGLLHPLEIAAGKSTTSSGNAGWGVLLLIFAIPFLIAGRWLLTARWSEALFGLVSPFLSFDGIIEGNPWKHSLGFFGIQIPFLLVTPVSQLLLAWLCFQIMVRRLVNPLNPPFSKRTAYLALVVFDLLAGSVLFEPRGFGMPIVQRSAAFCLAHLLISMAMVSNVTPWRESLQSWIWRLRGPSAKLQDLWLGNRSENGLALLTFCLIGAVSLGTFVLLPAARDEGMDKLRDQQNGILSVLCASTLLLFALGTLYQWCVAVGGRSGRGVFASLSLILIVPAHIAGSHWEIDFVQATSPSAHFQRWLGQGAPLNQAPLFITYGALLVIAWVLLRRYVRRVDRVVGKKLQNMGVAKAVA